MKTPTPTSEKKPRTPSKTKSADVVAPSPSTPVKPAVAHEKAAAAVKPTTPSKSPANPQPAVAKKAASAPAKAKKPQKPAESLTDSSPVPPAASDQPTASARPLPSQESINRMVEEAAYYLAEQRNFAPGFEEEDWLTAKQQIIAQLAKADNPVK